MSGEEEGEHVCAAGIERRGRCRAWLQLSEFYRLFKKTADREQSNYSRKFFTAKPYR